MSSGCGDVLTLEDLKTAKKHQIFEAEVITGHEGGVASGAEIDLSTNQVTGQTQKTMPAVIRDLQENAYDNLAPLGKVYTTAEATAAITSGEIADGAYFFIWATDENMVADMFQNVGGVITPTGKSIASGSYINLLSDEVDLLNQALPGYHQYSDDVALVVDEAGNVPVWLIDGKLGAAGIDGGTADRVIDASTAFPAYTMAPSKVALVVDEAGNVPVWLDSGKLDAFPSDDFANRVGDIAIKTVRNTSGSSLYGLRIKKAKLAKSVSGRCVGMMIGDSWSERNSIPRALADRMFANWGPRAGAGWVQLLTEASTVWENMIVSRSGWTQYDAAGTPTYGCGVDGVAFYTSSNTATASITNVQDTSGKVFYFDGTGTFTIGVGATTTTITGTGTGEYRNAEIPGLTAGLDTVSINTIGNTGVVSLHGFLFETSTTTGCMVHKCGNGGTWAGQHIEFITPQVPHFAAALNPDFIIVNLGTNDFLQNRTTATYTTALNGMIDAWRAALPNIGIIMVSPPAPNTSGATPMVDFRNAMRDVAKNKGVEWYDLYDDMPKTWSVGNALGWWADPYHPNDVGAEQIVNSMYELILAK